MSSRNRSTRSQPPSNTSHQSQSSNIPTVTIPPHASISDNAFLDRLLDDYNFAFDQGNQLTRLLEADHDPSLTARYLSGMILALDNLEDVVLRMERVGPGDWPFSRPSIGHWQETLANYLETAPSVTRSFDRIGDLSTHVFALCGKTGQVLKTGPGHVVGEVDSDPSEEVVINGTAVRTCSRPQYRLLTSPNSVIGAPSRRTLGSSARQ